MTHSRRYIGLMTALLAGAYALSAAGREVKAFDADWKFFRGDASAAARPNFDDSGWQAVNLPHDWSIAGPFSETNQTGGAGGFLPCGVAWYRKAFSLSKEDFKRHVSVEFDGVMQNSDVWLNGHHLGNRPNGYVSFNYDLTPFLKTNGVNILAVRCDTSAQPASRWYSGVGIYRHVRLASYASLHLEHWSTAVSTPVIASNRTVVHVETRVVNEAGSPQTFELSATIHGLPQSMPDRRYGCTNETKPLTLAAGLMTNVVLEIEIPWSPHLWSLECPDLYEALVQVRVSGTAVDTDTVIFGIREAKFTPEKGFMLNGKKVVLKGVCLHHDGGAFGAAVPLGIWEDRLKTLRSLGVNAIRTAHNPPAPEFLDLCDRLGFLVMDELFDCWTVAKNPYDYHLFFDEWSRRDAADTVRRDRNHPSVILWSIGNEIRDTHDPENALPIAHSLVEICHENDPTRPVTQALFRPNASGDYTNGLADSLDVVGTNYRDKELLAAQRAKPERKIIGTEQRHDRETWLNLRDNPSHAGQFLWIGVDYLGESRKWPRVGYAGGLLDRTGAVKPMAFERQSWWNDVPMVRLVRRVAPDDKIPNDPGYGGQELHTQVQFADWTPRDLTTHDETVEAYSNCEEVELWLNGRSLGVKKINADASPRVWKIPFESGRLKAVARNDGKVVACDELRTAGNPVCIKLETQNTKLGRSWDDVAIARATIVDANGIPIPDANNLISFRASGPGKIVAVDNGDNDSHEPFQTTERSAFHGTCAAFVKATSSRGIITITASAKGLKKGKAHISTATSR